MNVHTLEEVWLSDDEFVLDPTRITLYTGSAPLSVCLSLPLCLSICLCSSACLSVSVDSSSHLLSPLKQRLLASAVCCFLTFVDALSRHLGFRV